MKKMKQPIRFFSIGLFLASILLYGFYFFYGQSSSSQAEMTVDELIEKVESEGYRVISEEDYVSYTFFKEQENVKEQNDEDTAKNKDKNKKEDKKKDKDKTKKDDNDKSSKSDDEEKNEEEVIEHTFTTSDGVVSQDIADILVENNIIDDRQAFLDFLENNDYSSYIQIGKFTVTSDMSFEDIAKVITTYPGS